MRVNRAKTLGTIAAAAFGLCGLAGTASAHTGNFVVYRTSSNELRILYAWSFPTFLDEWIPPLRGDAFNVEIEPLVIPNVGNDEYPPQQGTQIWLEVLDAVPEVYYHDQGNLSNIIWQSNQMFCGAGGTSWNAGVWIRADQFHPNFDWNLFEWWVDIRVHDRSGLLASSPVYRMRIGLENICPADVTAGAIPGQQGYAEPNGFVTNDDFFVFLTLFAENSWRADLTSSAIPGAPGFGDQDFMVTNDDFFYYLMEFVNGCRL